MYRYIVRPFLFLFDAEKIHLALFRGLKFYYHLSPLRFLERQYCCISDSFSKDNLHFNSRIGLSAGLDKNAEVFDTLSDFGFGFIEIGTVTPHAQKGNPAPRILRFPKDNSLLSRTGFNNPGAEQVLKHIRKYKKHNYVLGVNINKDVSSAGDQVAKDFEYVFNYLYNDVDYFTVNMGSIPNDEFEIVLNTLTTLRKGKNLKKSLFIKLPADISHEGLDMAIALAEKYGIEGFIATGPTQSRDNLTKTDAETIKEAGSGTISGGGIGKKSLIVVRTLAAKTKHRFLIIGAGGILTAQDAENMLKAGADLIQIYSAFIYSGPAIARKMEKRIKSNWYVKSDL